MPTTNLLSSDLHISGKTVLIIGNRSYKNMGDELILLGTVKLLIKQKKDIIVSCYDPKRLKGFFSQFIDTKQITFIHEIPKGPRSFFPWVKKGWLKELKYFRTTDTVILGGGEILTEENSSGYRYWLISMRPFLFRAPFRKGQDEGSPDWSGGKGGFLYIMWGIQTPKSRLNKSLLHFLLNHTTHLYLRDFQTVEEVKKFWYPNVDFFMDTSYFAYEWDTVPTKKTDQPYIVINITSTKFCPRLKEQLTPYITKWYTIYYVPVSPQDANHLKAIEEHLDHTTSFQILEWQDFEQFVPILKQSEKVICTRLHLFLVANFLGVPTEIFISPMKVPTHQHKLSKMQEVINKVL